LCIEESNIHASCGKWLKLSRCQNFVYFAFFCKNCGFPSIGSFSYTELAEIISSKSSVWSFDDLADGIYGDTQVHRNQFQRRSGPKRFGAARGGATGAIERILVPELIVTCSISLLMSPDTQRP